MIKITKCVQKLLKIWYPWHWHLRHYLSKAEIRLPIIPLAKLEFKLVLALKFCLFFDASYKHQRDIFQVLGRNSPRAAINIFLSFVYKYFLDIFSTEYFSEFSVCIEFRIRLKKYFFKRVFFRTHNLMRLWRYFL